MISNYKKRSGKYINTWSTFITLIITILIIITSVVAFNSKMQNDVIENTKDITEIKETTKEIEENVINNAKRISVIETHYTHIKNQLDRIENKLEVIQ